LPALAVALQQPEHHDLAALAREGASALDAPLRNDVLRRGTATAAPSLTNYLLALRSVSQPEARTVAFASIVFTQLAQTLDAGRAEGGLSRSVLGAVAGSTGLLIAALTVRPLRTFLGLAMPTPLGAVLVAAGALVAVLLGRMSPSPGSIDSVRSFPLPYRPGDVASNATRSPGFRPSLRLPRKESKGRVTGTLGAVRKKGSKRRQSLRPKGSRPRSAEVRLSERPQLFEPARSPDATPVESHERVQGRLREARGTTSDHRRTEDVPARPEPQPFLLGTT
jgi:hypothetical protein